MSVDTLLKSDLEDAARRLDDDPSRRGNSWATDSSDPGAGPEQAA